MLRSCRVTDADCIIIYMYLIKTRPCLLVHVELSENESDCVYVHVTFHAALMDTSSLI